ncbi:ExbD/TolR family protein [Simiduia agarivorans]|uniref:Biopolymer transport protein ExbD/TolR n=1 Tax=Simiduia agarivorans (strain DSM 21679 / JCM 13881 / BCRC 17597 / SA1) TaxID=1117647 RepID=K4KMG1_SIMAS|nr:biopolymer transporter ExbD [Simiduia agarivorans]AFV00365.1 biopolymer transport protein ExbD/TolR [Simiduia agarivorans SA1 = DSM 21679]
MSPLRLTAPLRAHAYTADSDDGLELTPLLDIVFLVVAFLLLTANARVLQLPVSLPSVEQGQTAVAEPHVIRVAVHEQAPHYQLEDQRPLDWPALQRALEQALIATPDAQVQIQPAKTAPAEALIRLLAHLHSQQITNTQLLMTPEA